jgi:outer membrane autotransporter protein
VDGLVGFGQSDYDLNRRIFYQPGVGAANPVPGPRDRTAESDTDSDEFAISVGGGYSLGGGAFTYGPFARLDYVAVDIDGYEESGAQGLNLKVEDQDIDSFQGVLGGEVSYSVSTGFGVLVPQARLGWVHEFADDDRRIKATYVNDPNQVQLVAETDAPDRDYGTLLLGLAGVFQGGAQAFVSYETVLGLRDVEEHLFTIGGRIDF